MAKNTLERLAHAEILLLLHINTRGRQTAIVKMRAVNELLPTEGLLLLDIKKTTGQQLLVKTIEELIFLGVIQIRTRGFDGERIKIISLYNSTSPLLKDYHNLFITSIREHYLAYEERTAKNALTPHRLIGYVRYKLGFNDNKFKFEHIYERLKLWDVVKSKFPFYYINRSLTLKGKNLKNELIRLINDLEQEIKTTKNKDRLAELSKKLGPNIILIPGVFRQIGEIKFETPKYFEGPVPEIHTSFIDWEILNQADLHIPHFESIELPDFELPDLDV